MPTYLGHGETASCSDVKREETLASIKWRNGWQMGERKFKIRRQDNRQGVKKKSNCDTLYQEERVLKWRS